MSVLLRRPDLVPALFSAVEPAPRTRRRAGPRGRLSRAMPFLWAAAVLAEAPLVKAAAAAVGIVLPN